ncbi:MAG: ABC transporter substrate-binding protein [Oscillospiraceae bacterium]|nr:ABC transporter substrate-binding protein [Oscillospiraceae bacterium]
MNKERLYRAIGNIDDKYIVSVHREISSEKPSFSDMDSSLPLSQNERTIEVSVVRKTKRRISIIVAAALLIGSVAAAAVFMGTKKDKKEYTEKKIENYFIEDENFSLPETVYGIDAISADKESIYYAGYMQMGEDSKSVVSVFSIPENKKYDIDLTGYESDVITPISISESELWIQISDNDRRTLLRADRKTLEINGSLELGENEWIYYVSELTDGTYQIRKYVLDEEIKDYYICTYDRNLNLISEKSVMHKDVFSKPDVVWAGTETDESGNYYVVYSDDKYEYTLLKYSSDDSLLYEQKNITSDMEGQYSGIFIAKDGNPVIYSSKSDSSVYFFNELDSETGEVSQRYEIKPESNTYISIWGGMARGQAPGRFDFSYILNNKVYGCCLEDEENVIIADINQENIKYSGCAVSENALLITGINSVENSSGMYLCKSDYEGNIISYTDKYSLSESNTIRRIRRKNNGELSLLVSEYNDETQEETFYAVTADSDLNILNRTELECEYADDFIIDDNGKIAFLSNDTIVMCDRNGNKSFSQDSSYRVSFFETTEGYYCAEVIKDKCKTVIYKIDFDKNTLVRVNELDCSIVSAENGNGKYDAYFKFNEGVYGYCLSDNSLTEIVNWIDSDFNFPADQSVVVDNDIVVNKYFDLDNKGTRMNITYRADDETLKKIQERKVINIAASNICDGIRAIINDFNKSNTGYRIHIEDYSKYEANSSYFSDSGINAIEQELIKGNTPDMILFGQDFDMMRFAGFDAFADIDELPGITDINKDEYFGNVIDAYRFNGKQYAMPVSFYIEGLCGKKEAVSDIKDYTVNEFAELNSVKNLFYSEPYIFLTEYLINSNICDYIDTEKFTCSFDTEEFVSLLKIVKENGITEEEYYKRLSDSDKTYETRMADDLCLFMPLQIFTFSDFSRENAYYFCGAETALTGLPSDSHSGAVIVPEFTVAVFKNSENKEAAVEFLKILLSDNGQNQVCQHMGYMGSFPVKKSAYNQLFEKTKNATTIHTTDCHGKETKVKKPDKELLETVTDFITSASSTSLSDSKIKMIISEETERYYADTQSAEETAKNIQNKVTVYLKEIK